jgi:hypothetical protein
VRARLLTVVPTIWPTGDKGRWAVGRGGDQGGGVAIEPKETRRGLAETMLHGSVRQADALDGSRPNVGRGMLLSRST